MPGRQQKLPFTDDLLHCQCVTAAASWRGDRMSFTEEVWVIHATALRWADCRVAFLLL